MPKRINTRKVMGGPQGADAYVVIKAMTWGESQAMLQRINEVWKPGDEQTPAAVVQQNAEANRMLADYVVEWNWVGDEAGEKPLPQPGKDPEVFKALLNEEVKFLLESLQGVTPEEKKETSLSD
jgi:hypothetical protein